MGCGWRVVGANIWPILSRLTLSQTVNGGLGLSAMLFVCHFVPLNYYVLSDDLCVPIWVLTMTIALAVSFLTCVILAIEANELIRATTKSFLHDWQLKLTMIG